MVTCFFTSPLQLILFLNYLNILLYLILNIAGSFFTIWFCIELHIVSFLFWSYFMNNTFEAPYLLYYFLIQSLSSLVLLGSYYLIVFYSGFSFVFLLFLLVNLGVIPFSGWYYRVLLHINVMSIAMGFTQQNFPSYLLFISAISHIQLEGSWLVWFLIILVVSMFGSVVIGLYSLDLVSVLIWSSVVNSVWILLVIYVGVFWFVMFWGLYFYLIIIIIQEYISKNNISMFSIVALATLAGFPPFPIFFLKFFSIYTILVSDLNLSILEWGVLVLSFLFLIVLSSVVMVVYSQLVLVSLVSSLVSGFMISLNSINLGQNFINFIGLIPFMFLIIYLTDY